MYSMEELKAVDLEVAAAIENELPFVFERFYKGDKSRSNIKNSLGLGLYLVKTIVLAHKGQVSVTSKQGEFTAFKVILPKGEH